MERANDMAKTERELRDTVRLLALRVNQLERLLDQKEISEAKVEGGVLYHRPTRLSLANGMSHGAWTDEELAGSVTGLPSNAGKSKYMVLQLSDNVGATADDPTKWTIDYVRAHA